MIIFKLDDLFWKMKKTAKEVHEATGITETTLSNIRNGKNKNISVETLNKLCRYFKCNVDDILEYQED